MEVISKIVLVIGLLGISSVLFSQGFTEMDDMVSFEHPYGMGEYGGGPSFVDFNLDGLDDITMTSGNFDSLYFYVNNGDGFDLIPSPISNLNETKQIIWVDTDNDYDLDCYITSKQTNSLYINEGDLVFTNVTETCGFDDPPSQSFNATWLDFDGDGLLDLAVGHRVSHLVGYITLYHNLGDNQFEDVTEEAGLLDIGNSILSFASLDFNNDGLQDIHVGQDYDAGTMLLKNMGDGTFADIAIESGTYVENNTMTSSIGDFNGDGWMDIYVTNTSPGNSFFVNQGDENFIESSDEFGLDLYQFTFGAVWLDAENDGDIDIYINGLNSSADHSCPMMMNIGTDDPFVMMNDFWGFEDDSNTSSNGNAIGDFNNDGYPDIVKMNSSINHSLWRNDFDANNYLSVDLVGVVSNSFAVGAVIEIVVGETHQYRHIGCGQGWSSQNSYTQFFGIGDNEMIDTLFISWPSGMETAMTNVEINQRITVWEVELVFGCTNLLACNFNPEATNDDDSCVFPDEFYDCDGSCLIDTDEDGICDELEIEGCQDFDACNYNPEATDEDLSCIYVPSYMINGVEISYSGSVETYTYTETFGSSYEWEIVNGSILSGQGTNEVSIQLEGDSEMGIGVTISVTETTADGCVGEPVFLFVLINFIGVEEYENWLVNIWPNPVADFLNISSEQPIYEVTIYDQSGRVLLITDILNGNKVDVHFLSKGIYYIELISGDRQKSVQKFLKE